MGNFELHLGDCLDVMATLPDASVDCVLTDPPYGTTACKWDSVIPFEPMWKELKRIAKPKAAICLFGSQPFTSALVMSNIQDFKYQWVWQKYGTGNFALAKYQPLRETEDIAMFSRSCANYFPQMRRGKMRGKGGGGICAVNGITPSYSINDEYYPTNVLHFSNANFTGRGDHPTQKPVELLRYLIRTYTNEGETVLDFTMGSGSTGVACELENRNFIGIEKDADYFEIAQKRIADVKAKEPLFMEAAA